MCEEPNAIALASADAVGRPAVRMVLLKGYDARGFVFYTNYSSRKGQELSASGAAAFCCFWEGLQRSVRCARARCLRCALPLLRTLHAAVANPAP